MISLNLEDCAADIGTGCNLFSLTFHCKTVLAALSRILSTTCTPIAKVTSCFMRQLVKIASALL